MRPEHLVLTALFLALASPLSELRVSRAGSSGSDGLEG